MSDADSLDALTDRSPDGVLWSRVNSAETFPGVLTPITWSVYREALETSVRAGFFDLGVVQGPRPHIRIGRETG